MRTASKFGLLVLVALAGIALAAGSAAATTVVEVGDWAGTPPT
jgi:hypothetical protein